MKKRNIRLVDFRAFDYFRRKEKKIKMRERKRKNERGKMKEEKEEWNLRERRMTKRKKRGVSN